MHTTSSSPTNSTGSRVPPVSNCAELLERAWHPASPSTCVETVQSPSSPLDTINPRLLQLPPLNDSHNPTHSNTSLFHTTLQHTRHIRPSTSRRPLSNLEVAITITPMIGPTSMIKPSRHGSSPPNSVVGDLVNEGRSNVRILAPLPRIASTARLHSTTSLGSSFSIQPSLRATSSKVTLDHMRLFDDTVVGSQPQWITASNSTTGSRQALGGGSAPMPPRSKRARSVSGEPEDSGEQSQYEKNSQTSVEREENGEQSQHEESLQTPQRSASQQQVFDRLPAPETAGVGCIIRTDGPSQIPEYTYFDPRVSQQQVPFECRLSLYSQNTEPSTTINQPYRCRYIGPWNHTLCDKLFTNIHSWRQHFRNHASEERKENNADPDRCRIENAIALKDPQFSKTASWRCDICGYIGKSYRKDSLKRHKMRQHGIVEPSAKPPRKRRRLK